MELSFFDTLVMLVLAHFLADYPLQGDFMAKAKNRSAPIPGVPWQWVMAAHAFIHAGLVYVITGGWLFLIVEFFLHFLIDDLKCKRELSFGADQFLHLMCKLLYALLITAGTLVLT